MLVACAERLSDKDKDTFFFLSTIHNTGPNSVKKNKNLLMHHGFSLLTFYYQVSLFRGRERKDS